MHRCGKVNGRANNKSGTEGVTIRHGRWRASIGINEQRIELGYWDLKEDAIAARHEAELLKNKGIYDFSHIRKRASLLHKKNRSKAKSEPTE